MLVAARGCSAENKNKIKIYICVDQRRKKLKECLR